MSARLIVRSVGENQFAVADGPTKQLVNLTIPIYAQVRSSDAFDIVCSSMLQSHALVAASCSSPAAAKPGSREKMIKRYYTSAPFVRWLQYRTVQRAICCRVACFGLLSA